MTNRHKIALAMLILRFLADEETTHHVRKILATIAYDLLENNDTPVSFIYDKDNPNNIPF